MQIERFLLMCWTRRMWRVFLLHLLVNQQMQPLKHTYPVLHCGHFSTAFPA